jgi:hypothetical protein
MSIELKRSLYDKELLYIYTDYLKDQKARSAS